MNTDMYDEDIETRDGRPNVLSALLLAGRTIGYSEELLAMMEKETTSALVHDTDLPARSASIRRMFKVAASWNGDVAGYITSDIQEFSNILQRDTVKRPDLAYVPNPLSNLVKQAKRYRTKYCAAKRTLSVSDGGNEMSVVYTKTGEIARVDPGLLALGGWSFTPTSFMGSTISLRYLTGQLRNTQQNLTSTINKIAIIDSGLSTQLTSSVIYRTKFAQRFTPPGEKILAKGNTQSVEELVAKTVDPTKVSQFVTRVLTIENNCIQELRKISDGYRLCVTRQSTQGLMGIISGFRDMRKNAPDATKHVPFYGGPNYASIVEKQALVARIMGFWDDDYSPIDLNEDERRPAKIVFGSGTTNIAYTSNIRANKLDFVTSGPNASSADLFDFEFVKGDQVLSDVMVSESYLKTHRLTHTPEAYITGTVAAPSITPFDRTYCVVEHLAKQPLARFSAKVILNGISTGYSSLANLHNTHEVIWSMGGRHHNTEVFLTCKKRESVLTTYTSAVLQRIVRQYVSYAVAVNIDRYIAELTCSYEAVTRIPKFVYPTQYDCDGNPVSMQGYLNVPSLFVDFDLEAETTAGFDLEPLKCDIDTIALEDEVVEPPITVAARPSAQSKASVKRQPPVPNYDILDEFE